MWTKPIAVLLICVARGNAANLFDRDERVEAPTFSALKNAKSDKPELFANKLAALASACCVNVAKDTCHTTDKCNKKEKECIKCNKKTGGYKWKVPGSGDPPSGPPPPSPPCCLVIATNTCHVEAKCNKKEKDCLKNKCQKTFVAGASGEAKWKRRNNPTRAPSNSPTTAAPSGNPTRAPSNSPTAQPTSGPTSSPTTAAPSRNPTAAPSNVPTAQPTLGPTSAPTTAAPSRNPTPAPSNVPTAQPTSGPTSAPTTAAPSSSPTHGPTTSPTTAPSKAPTAQPTLGPTSAPTTAAPSRNPTPAPSNSPTAQPTSEPTSTPTTAAPSSSPTQAPTEAPVVTGTPTAVPTSAPSNAPTSQPTSGPTSAPTTAATSSSPTQAPTKAPVVTGTPTAVPTSAPSNAPTSQPTSGPTSTPTTAAPSSSPTQAPTKAPVVTGTPTAVPTSAPSNAPTSQPTSGPTSTPTTAAPSSSPTHAPTEAPVTATPTTAVPTSAPSAHLTEDPTAQPTSPPTTAAPTLNDPTIYQYTDTGKTCSIGGGNNVQGPLPLADKRNVVIDFWAFGDSPYDYLVNTCLDDDGNPSTCNDCAVSNSNMEDLPYPNTCTFEGEDFECLKESIIPFMNRKMNGGDGAFQLHVGDILKGVPDGNSRRCTEASFDSRARLFQPAKNVLLINGDNESNECMNYDIREASDPVRDMWREKFGKYSFASDFPAITGGGRPAISRVEGNEEIFGFEHKNIAFFGLDYPAGDTYITKHAPQDLNAKFVKESLASDTSCALRSIVLFSHSTPGTLVYEALDEYFEGMCGVLPTLAVLGNAHPSTYCLTKENEKLSLTVEAFQSGPVLVSVVRDPKEGGSDYFHVADSDLVNSNSQCPEFATPSPTNAMTPAPTPNPASASVTTPAPSNAPNTVPEPPTSTLTIVFSGDGDPPTPLPNCRGDCDNDDHCEGSLVCFHRSGTESVPSCQGTAPSGEDFCAERATEKTVWLKGSDGIPDENFPLGLCEGDCDEDSDCQLGLVCQQREGTETIPGCVGVPEPGEDYCRYPDLTMVGNPPSRKLRVCEGDCDVDSDCGPNLQCFQRPGTETVSGCLGTGRSGMDYCALRPTVNTLFLKGNNGSPRGNFPLGLCEGDCDGDDECRDGLVCMSRSGDEVVPGCIGIRTYGEDYCYDALD